MGKAARRRRRLEAEARAIQATAAELAQPRQPPITGTSWAGGMEFVDVDNTRTLLVEGAFARSMLGLTLGEAPDARVMVDLAGKWNHGAPDSLTIILSPELARDLGPLLGEAGDAAELDLAAYLAGANPATHEPRRATP